jgi:hypothetical protein
VRPSEFDGAPRGQLLRARIACGLRIEQKREAGDCGATSTGLSGETRTASH